MSVQSNSIPKFLQNRPAIPPNPFSIYADAVSSHLSTQPEDALGTFSVSLDGLRSTLGTQFLHGLPMRYFNPALLWTGAQLSRKPSNEGEPCPSWSWCAWSGAKGYDPALRSELANAKSRIHWPWYDCQDPGVFERITKIMDTGILEFETEVAKVEAQKLQVLGDGRGDRPGGAVEECILLSGIEGESIAERVFVMVVQRGEEGVLHRKDIAAMSIESWAACNPVNEVVRLN